MWTSIHGTTLWNGDEKDCQNVVPRTAILKSTPFVVYIVMVSWSGLFCCVLLPSTLAFHLLFSLSNCDCLVYSVS